MKKISVLLLLLALILPSVFAGEEASPQPLALNPIQGESAATTLPFEFSLTRGEWKEAKAGALFTSGTPSADFVLPSLKEAPLPIRYPRWAVREGWEGNFVIAIEILKTGEVGRWEVMESTQHPLLDQAATEAVRQWKFNPATELGKPIVSCIQIPIHFRLKD